jgi:hypothetical protein
MPSVRSVRYSLDALRKHTKDIRLTNSEIIRQHRQLFDAVIGDFDRFFTELEHGENRLLSNVQKILATKFFNHWYSTLLLCEAGLMVDAVTCERNAMETLAYHWLVRLDASAAEAYQENSLLRPVEVRKRLEVLGADISHLRITYGFGSKIAHVGRDSEVFHLHWRAISDGQLLLGGRFSKRISEHWFAYLPALLQLFQEPMMSDDPKASD